MPLETAQYIHQLDAANPLGSDPIAAGDDHLRLIKAAIKATFPNITGPVTATQGTINSPFPVGGIIMWSGAIAAVPSGWAICDGTNGTPDLRSRFVVGAGSDYAVGATGGANSVTLTESQIPSHTHTATTDSQGAHTHTITDPGHTHVVNNAGIFNTGVDNVLDYGSGTAHPLDGEIRNAVTTSSTTGITLGSAGAHTHTITVGSVGGGQSHENRPPYYALAYIMKLAY